MSPKTLDSHVRFSLEQPSAPDVPTPPLWHESSPSDDPPPWEPHFEDLSPPSCPQSLRRRPLDPPPRCFSIPSPLRIRSHDFPPIFISAVSDKLTDGFRLLHPRGVLDKHGIDRADWIRFLEDLNIAARLAGEGVSAVGSRVPISPLLAHRVFPSRACGAVYDRQFTRNPAEEVCALIQIWNQCAFERRKIRVTLQARPTGASGRKSYVLVVESL